MSENCLLCLSTFSGGGNYRPISSLFKLVQADDAGHGDDDDRLVLCPECQGIVDSATEIHNEISKLQIKLKTEIHNVREIILKSTRSKEKCQPLDKTLKLRQTFINLTTGETWIKDEEEVIVDETVVKMEEFEENEIDFEFDGPFSPSALMLDPLINDDDIEDNSLHSKQERSEDEEPQPKRLKSSLPNSSNYSTDSGNDYRSDSDYQEVEELTNSSDDEEAKSNKLNNKAIKPKIPIQRKPRIKKEKTKKVFPCQACGRKFDINMKMILHMFSKHETDDKPFSCSKSNCNKKFTLEVNLQRHLKGHEKENARPMVCEFCDSRFVTQTQLDVHHKYHKGYPCKCCGKLLMSSSSLKRHLRIHTGVKPYTCSVCKESFIDHITRQIHIEKAHEKKQHCCNLCQAIFDTKYGLQAHLKKHEKRGDGDDVKCEEAGCGATFNNHNNLSVHQIKVHGVDPFVCDECKYGLKHHKKKHTGIKNYKCDKCNAAFFTAFEVKTHSVIHSKERPFVCSFCGNAFKTKQKLRVHEKTMHSKDYVPNYKFQCQECENKFSNKTLLEGHIRQIHTGERPFVCHFPSCEQKYALKYALTQHLRKSHGISPTLKFDKAPRSKRDAPLKSAPKSRQKRRKQESEEDPNSTSRSSNEDLNNEVQQSKLVSESYTVNTGQDNSGNFQESAFSNQNHCYQF